MQSQPQSCPPTPYVRHSKRELTHVTIKTLENRRRVSQSVRQMSRDPPALQISPLGLGGTFSKRGTKSKENQKLHQFQCLQAREQQQAVCTGAGQSCSANSPPRSGFVPSHSSCASSGEHGHPALPPSQHPHSLLPGSREPGPMSSWNTAPLSS